MKSLVNKAYKFRIYPSKEQEIFLSKHFGCVRFIYNYLLSARRDAYRSKNRKISGFECKRMISCLKKREDFFWLKEVNSQSLQEAALDLCKAYNRFFKKVNKARYPNFKKKNQKQSFCIPQHFQVDTKNNCVLIPKLKTPIKTLFHRKFGNVKKINFLTLSKTPANKYYISINVEEKIVHKKPVTKVHVKTKTTGIDLGLIDFLVTSKGYKTKSPKFLRKSQEKLKKRQIKLSKRIKGSKNRNKQRKIVAKLYEKTSNQRKDFIHKESRRLVSKNQVIYLETLNVKNMLKNKHLSKSISDAGWGEFIRQLKYKAQWFGTIVVQIGQWEPTSKLCSTQGCDYKKENLFLSDRFWKCPICKMIHDRDINAAKNVERIGREASELTPVEKTANVFSIKKIQADSMKQESLAS